MRHDSLKVLKQNLPIRGSETEEKERARDRARSAQGGFVLPAVRGHLQLLLLRMWLEIRAGLSGVLSAVWKFKPVNVGALAYH